MKRWGEKLVELILMMSGTVSIVAVILMTVFLFREASGLIGHSAVEDDMCVTVNRNNVVGKISAQELRQIFDKEVTKWSALGLAVKSEDEDSILLFRVDDIVQYYNEEQLGDSLQYVPKLVSALIDSLPGILAFIPEKYISDEFKGRKISVAPLSTREFIFGISWLPTAKPAAQFGVWPLILGTLWVSLIAILIALPVGISCAIYLSELADWRWRKIFKPLIDLLAGIPSVVYGFFGLVVIVPMIQNTFGLPVGETALAGSIVLAIMALPTIISIAEDALRSAPQAMKEASYALGANRWQTIYKVLLPYSLSGIAAAAILGIGRAIGETMAVLMVTGNAAVVPHSILEPVRTIPATIAAELGEAPQGGQHYKALFLLAVILFIITFVLNLTVDIISRRRNANKN
ncbi:MAG: phosphate ABC transporter permease subunit PstC [Saprospiraceae bacterium]